MSMDFIAVISFCAFSSRKLETDIHFFMQPASKPVPLDLDAACNKILSYAYDERRLYSHKQTPLTSLIVF